ncbi:RNA-binding domain-containing protein [Acephala macrosclerotiorum]|nr:RNA-binding domain-containing protein [Acephala macrosclerotiorum]
MFIGGLNWETTDQSLKEYFSQFGEVLECTVMRDGASGRSRGFGFLTFKDARTVNIVMVKEHYLDGKIVRPDFQTHDNSLRHHPSTSELLTPPKHNGSFFKKIDPKRAIPRDEQEKTSKIFVGGVSQEATEQDFKEYFMQFGRVVDATLMMDKDTGRPRGFGFVTFDSEAAVDQCLAQPLEILGKPIEVKKAQPRGNMREEEEPRGGARGGKFRRGNDDSQNANQVQQGGGGSGQMAPGGMTPQLMAQYWQRMQQYFAMMQQQMAMGGGRGMPMGGMNPAMMMQMQQMQAMQQQMGQGNRSQSPQSPGAAMAGMQGMNPAMMAQMQQMQQMQMQGMGGGAGAMGAAGFGGNGGGSNPGGRMGTPGYNAYEQQMFEQQKYEQQQARRSQRDQSQYGGGGYGMGGGGPTSWEGMYDDVPQPAVPTSNGGGSRGGRGGSRGSQPPQTPASAPPANAPTGPKNAGKPGANYRGGGRGGNRGFHPYAR